MRPPGPFEVVRLLGQARAAIVLAVGAVPQLVALLGELNALVLDARKFIADSQLTQQQAARLVEAVESTRRQAQQVADNAGRTQQSAAAAVAEARELVGDVRSLLERFEPALGKLAPITDFVADELTVEHAEALTGLIQDAPDLVDKLSNDVVPVLDSLGTVGADLREVVDTTQQMDEMLGAVPGLGRVKKRIEKKERPPRRPVSASPRVQPPADRVEP
jgi:ABC-type transporter Mla subunit MlaD